MDLALVNTLIPFLCIILIFSSVFVIIEVEAAKKKILTEQQKLLSTAEVPDNESQHMIAIANSTPFVISANDSLVMEHDKCLMYLRDINANSPANAISNITGKADIMDLHVNMTMCDFLFLPHVFNNTHHNIVQ